MYKKTGLVFTLLLAASTSMAATEPELKENDITYESLTAYPHSFTDHVVAFHKLFEFEKIDTFLEFGLGVGTKYFIDNCKSVISMELIGESTRERAMPWYTKTVQMLSHHTNWTPLIYNVPPLVNTYEENYAKGKYITTDLQEYLQDIHAICDKALKNRKVDVVFIDQGMHPRGYFISYLFGKVDIIVAHDTSTMRLRKFYAYDKIPSNRDYVKIEYKSGSGTTFWIKKDKKELIEHLQKAFAS